MNNKRKNNGNVKDKYEFEYCVGEGAFGFVHKARQRDKPSNLVAIKAFKKANKDGEGISFTICREIAVRADALTLYPFGSPSPILPSFSLNSTMKI